MTRYPCRCRKCGARLTLDRQPDKQRCPCGGSYRVDWYRRKTEHKRTNCFCDGYHWSISNGPHRKGSASPDNGWFCYHWKGYE